MALTKFLGLIVSIISKLAEEGVLLREEHLHVLHADVDDSGSDVGAQRVNTLKTESSKESRTQRTSLSHTIKQTNKNTHIAFPALRKSCNHRMIKSSAKMHSTLPLTQPWKAADML